MKTAAVLALFALLSPNAILAEEKPPVAAASKRLFADEAALKKTFLLEDVQSIRYLDRAGKPIGFEAFVEALMVGEAFSKQVDADHRSATLQLKEKPAATTAAKQKATSLSVPVGGQMPEPGALTDLAGQAHRLANGKHYSLLSFFFSECVPCIQEIPDLNALDTRSAQLKVLSITFDDRKQARMFVDKRGLKTAVIADAQAYIDQLGIRGYPTLVLVSPEGRLVAVKSGYMIKMGDKGEHLAQLANWLADAGVKLD